MLARLVNGVLLGSIARIRGVLQALATGDLTRRLEVESGDSLGPVATLVNGAIDRMRAALGTDRVDWDEVARERENIDLLQAMVHGSPLGILVSDERGRVRYANPAAVAVLETLRPGKPFSTENLRGRSVEEQRAVTKDISQAVNDAACGSQAIARSIESVSASSRATSEVALAMKRAAGELTETGREPEGLVDRHRIAA